MSSELTTVWRHGRVYAIGAVLNRGAAFLLLPLYAHMLTAEDFGIFALVTAATDLLAVLLGLGFGNAMARIYFDEPEPERGRVVSTAIFCFAAAALPMAGIVIALAPELASLLLGDARHGNLLALGVAALVFTTLFNVQLNYFRVIQRSWAYVLTSAAKLVLFVAFNVLFVVALELRVMGILLATLLASSVLSLVLLIVILRRTGAGFSLRLVGKLAGFGLPMVPAALLDTLSHVADRYLLQALATVSGVGLYALAARLSSALFFLILAPFGQIWVVRRMAAHGDRKTEEELAQVFLLFSTGFAAAALALALFAPEILAVIAAPEFAAAASLLPLLAATQISIAIRMHFETGVLCHKKSSWLPAVSMLALVVNLGLNVALIPLAGATGAALALLGTEIIRALVMAYLDARLRGGLQKTVLLTTLSLVAVVALPHFVIDRFPSSIDSILIKALVLALVGSAALLATRSGRRLILRAKVPLLPVSLRREAAR